MAKTIAEVIIESLKNSGVERVYGLPGDSLNGFTDAIRKDGSVEWAHTRNEEVAAFAAGAEAHLTGKLAVCAGSCGPGNLHLINGLYDCHRSRVPVLAIAAQIPGQEIGTGYFQETHPELLFKECSGYCELVSIPEQMPRLLEIAMRTAITKSCVAVLVIPGEIFLHDATHDNPVLPITAPQTVVRPSDAELAQAAEIINHGSKVTLLAGAGCKGAHAQVMALAGALKAPIVHALRGKEYLEHDNPYDVGLTGLIGFSSGYHAMENCDTLLMLGTDFPYTQFYPGKSAKVIQVDSRGEQIGRRTKVDLGLVGNVADTLPALLPLLTPKTDAAAQKRLDQHVKDYAKVREGLEELAQPDENKRPIHPQYVARLIDKLAADDAVFTCDVGTPTVWTARYIAMNGRRSLIGSLVHGSMASALAQGIGAQASHRSRQVIAMCGDGGLTMMMGDLITLKQLNLPVKLIIFNNSSLAFVELEMKAAGIVNYGTELANPDFAAVARAMGIHGIRVEDPLALEGALQEAFATPGPAMVEVLVNRQELSMPPSITFAQAKGFSLWAAKTVLSGRGDEVIDLAKTNLLQRILS